MVRLICKSRALQAALVVFSVVQVAGCASQDDRARSYYERALRYLSEHEQAKAAIELRNAVRLKTDFIDAWKLLAEMDEAKADWPRLASDLRTITELAPDDVAARRKLGKLLLLTGSPNEALALADAGLGRDDRNADLRALKAAIALKLGDRAGAVREAQSALDLDPSNADALTVLAIDRLSNGNVNGALSLLYADNGAKTQENNIEIQLLKVELLGRTGDFNSAEVILKQLVDRHPQQRSYRKLLVNFFVEQHRTEDAEREMRKLISVNPSDSTAVLELVRFLRLTRGAAAARQELGDRISAGGDVFLLQIALAELDFDEGNSTAGEQLLKTLIENGTTPDRVRTARIALARSYLIRRMFDAAEKSVDEILHGDSHNVPALTIRAKIRLERSQPDAAVPDLMAALGYRPRSVDLMLLLATAYERSGLIELADKQFADATRASAFDPRVGTEYASFLDRRGSPGRAEDVLVDVMKREPQNIQILSALAQLRLTRQNWIGAQEIANDFQRIGDSTTADQILGAALIGQRKYSDAIAVLKKAYEARPSPHSLDSLIYAYLKAGSKNQAVTFLQALLAKDPVNADALVLSGSIQLDGGETQRAIASLSAAIKGQPSNPVGYQALANLYRHQKDYDEAIKILRQGIQQRPDLPQLQIALASALEQKGDFEAAISEYGSILDTHPGDLIASNNLASLLLDHRGEAPDTVQRARAIAAVLRNSQLPQFKDTLGWLKYYEGDYSGAVSLCEEAVAALPDQAALRYHLGMAYAAIGRSDRASEQLNKALELTPQEPLLEQIRNAVGKLRPQSSSAGKPT